MRKNERPHYLFQEARKAVRELVVDLLSKKGVDMIELNNRLDSSHSVQYFRFVKGALKCNRPMYEDCFRNFDKCLNDKDLAALAEVLSKGEYTLLGEMGPNMARARMVLFRTNEGRWPTKMVTYDKTEFPYRDESYEGLLREVRNIIIAKGTMAEGSYFLSLPQPMTITTMRFHMLEAYHNVEMLELTSNGLLYLVINTPERNHYEGWTMKRGDLERILEQIRKL